MKKQKTKFLTLLALLFVSSFVLAKNAEADYGGATVSWVAPTTDEGNVTPMTGLTGYRVYYGTSAIDCTAWDAADQAARIANAGLLPATYRNVSSGSVLKYTFNNTLFLTPGSTYNFAVVAYDASGNLSKCATGTGGVTTVSKSVSYAADLDTSAPSLHRVNLFDYNILFANFGSTTPGNPADIDKNDVVNLFDYNILFADFGKSF